MAGESGSNPQKERVQPSTSPSQTDTRAWRITLIEDNQSDVLLIRESLSEIGFAGETMVIRDGEKALNWIAGTDLDSALPIPNLVILDLNLPRVSGDEILSAIRSSVRMAEVPVVVVSSSIADSDRRTVLALGANGFITKPADLDEFLTLGSQILAIVSGSR